MVQLDLVVQSSQDMRNGFLFSEWWARQTEIGNVRALQAVKHSANIDKGADLLPPIRATNKPAKEWWKNLCAIRAKQDEILAKRTFYARWNVGSFAGVAAARQNNIMMFWLGLSSPFNKVL